MEGREIGFRYIKGHKIELSLRLFFFLVTVSLNQKLSCEFS
jgi:hypothetical protein